MDRAELLSVPEAAEILGVSVLTIRRLVTSGELRAVRIRKRVLIPRTEVNRATVHGLERSVSARGSNK
jgi:excisionase family DNA binding protein